MTTRHKKGISWIRQYKAITWQTTEGEVVLVKTKQRRFSVPLEFVGATQVEQLWSRLMWLTRHVFFLYRFLLVFASRGAKNNHLINALACLIHFFCDHTLLLGRQIIWEEENPSWEHLSKWDQILLPTNRILSRLWEYHMETDYLKKKKKN